MGDINGARVSTPVIVVGAGPVGLAVASRLADHGVRVLVVEAGGTRRAHERDTATQSGLPFHHPVGESRARGLGGSSRKWIDGVFRCRPLDDSDFEPRSDGLREGWPLSARELDPYIACASRILGLSPGTFDPEELLQDGEELVSSEVLRTGLFRLGDLGRFRGFVGRTVARPEVTLLEDTETLRIRQDGHGRVLGITVATADGTRLDIDGGDVVLAAGGLENPRLLLLSTDCDERGIGGGSRLVGQGFMEHPHTELGHLVPAVGARLSQFDRRRRGDGGTEGYLSIDQAILLEHHLPAAGIWLHPVSLRDALRDLRDDAGRAARTRGTSRIVDGELARSARRVLWTATDRVRNPTSRTFHRLVRCELEQFAIAESAVTLGEETDRFGRPGVHVHWTLGPEFDDIHDRLLSVLMPAFESCGLGELVPFPPDSPRRKFTTGHHHIGTTRMSECPSHGVVDPDGAVHDAPGLHVAGSSVFPTAGAANPTLTAVALGLRLADRLAAARRS